MTEGQQRKMEGGEGGGKETGGKWRKKRVWDKDRSKGRGETKKQSTLMEKHFCHQG